MGEKTGMTKAGMTVDDWAFTAGGWQFFKALVIAAYESTIVVPNTATPGGDAVNCQLVSSDGTTHRELFDFMKPERPLVVNFGSCTWPPFVVQLARFNKLAASYADIADFLFVYIKEAHPTDGWSFTNNKYNIAQHKNLTDRLLAAQIVEDLCPGHPVLIDSMKNEACAAYKAFPERLYILKDEKVVLQGGEGPMDYSVAKIEEWLENFKQSTTVTNSSDDNNNVIVKDDGEFRTRIEQQTSTSEEMSIWRSQR